MPPEWNRPLPAPGMAHIWPVGDRFSTDGRTLPPVPRRRNVGRQGRNGTAFWAPPHSIRRPKVARYGTDS
jgi:hypothetical protein